MDVGVKNAKIIQIADNISEEANETFNAQNLVVLPGCMDTQVHFREPGSTDAEDLHRKSSGSRRYYKCLKCLIQIHQQHPQKNLKIN